MLNEVYTIDNIIVPCYAFEIREKANHPDQYSDSYALETRHIGISRPKRSVN